MITQDSTAGINELLPTRLRGNIDSVDDGQLVGWALSLGCPDAPLELEVRSGKQILGTGIADIPRDTLVSAGLGTGNHGFSIQLDVPFADGRELQLRLFEKHSGRPIAANPYRVHCLDRAWVESRELGVHGVHGRAPSASGQRRPALRRYAARWSRPFRQMGQRMIRQPVNTQPPEPPVALQPLGAQAVGDVAMLHQWPKVILPLCDTPEVSIIVPVYNQFQLTYQCLVSLVLSADATPFEVLLVDDCSEDATQGIEQRVENLRVIRNTENKGFLHNCNLAAEQACGEFLVFLNNDTEVSVGWLDELRDVFRRFEGVGATGAKLVYPDGRLQDAGGIVWETGNPWNVGHGKDPADPAFNYVRDVDYLTGAALMVERKAWEQVGGFTLEYAPAYYEDTDLAFKLRAAGYRTLYCPQASVTHFEGSSNGTSIDSGVKQYQKVNAERFVATWRNQFVGLGQEGVDLIQHKDRGVRWRVLMIDSAFPRLGEDAGGYAAHQEIRLMQSIGCKITFLPHNLLYLGAHVDALQRMGVECLYKPFSRSIEAVLSERGAEFDVVYVTRYSVAERLLPLVRRHTAAKLIFNNADLHFLRELRAAIANGHQDRSGPASTRERELAVMDNVDAVLSYSDTERQIIASHLLRDDHIYRCPWVVTPRSRGAGLADRKNIAFVGGFGHPPNVEAINWFVEAVMPLLHDARPGLVLNIWGSRMPANCNWNSYPGVRVNGYAHSLDDVFLSTRVFIAPLLSGAGIKGKVLDSLSYGVPTVLSPIAVEATGLVDGISTLIARDPHQWVVMILKLLDDDGLWGEMQTAMAQLYHEEYSFAAGQQRMQSLFNDLMMPAE